MEQAFALEYNERAGYFHHSRPRTRVPSTHGWKTIAERVPDSTAGAFCWHMLQLHPHAENEQRCSATSKVVQNEWAAFTALVRTLQVFKATTLSI